MSLQCHGLDGLKYMAASYRDNTTAIDMSELFLLRNYCNSKLAGNHIAVP
jgi:hypothetical protein